jgi:hypothetical protein
MHRDRISPLYIAWLAATVDLAGFAGTAVHAAAGCPAPLHDVDESWVSLEVSDRAIAAAIDATGDPALGLRAPSAAAVWLGPITNVVAHAPTVGRAFADMHRYAVLLATRRELDLAVSQSRAVVRFHPLSISPVGRRFRTERGLSGMITLLRIAGAGTADIAGVSFCYPRPDYADEYERRFGCQLKFDASESALHFSSSLLDAPWPGYDKHLYAASRSAADAARLARTGAGVESLVEAYLFERLPERPSVGEVASALHTTERTLRRHLAASGARYVDMLGQCRRRLAEQ